MNLRTILSLALAAAIALFVWRWVANDREEHFAAGADSVQRKWEAENTADLEAKAKEGRRRLDTQQENQRVQNLELAAARHAAARNDRAALQLRNLQADVARSWGQRLRDSPTVADSAAAGDAIGVLADVLGRADRRAGILARYADAARVAGLKCERDYDALNPVIFPTTER